MFKTNNEAQQIIEYLLLSVVVIVVLLYFFAPAGPLHEAVDTTLNMALSQIKR